MRCRDRGMVSWIVFFFSFLVLFSEERSASGFSCGLIKAYHILRGSLQSSLKYLPFTLSDLLIQTSIGLRRFCLLLRSTSG